MRALVVAHLASPQHLRLREVFAGLSYALDLTEGQRPGHSVRSTLIGMRIGERLDLPPATRESLFHALLLKDLGCSSNSARFAAIFGHDDHELKATLKTINWSNAIESFRFVATSTAPGAGWLTRVWRVLGVLARGPAGAREVVVTRCERGADIARLLGLSDETVQGIRSIDEHWDGHGQPYEVRGEAIPLIGRIAGLAQSVEVFTSSYGRQAAFDMARARRGRWFDPALVDALGAFEHDVTFWQHLGNNHELEALASIDAGATARPASNEAIDLVAEAFARVIDAKSPWTYQHSNGVAELATAMAVRLGFEGEPLRQLRLSALLHDLGKLGVSNLILDKPGKLDDDELAVMRLHPKHTASIMSRVPCFAPLADVAAAHHERLDGRGYHRGLPAATLPLAARILCVADIADALRASRPYRAGLPTERVLEIMRRDAGVALDADCLQVLADILTSGGAPAASEMPAAATVAALAEDYEQAA